MTPRRRAGFIWRGIVALLLAFVPLATCIAHADSATTDPSSDPFFSPLDILLPRFLRVAYNTRSWVRDSLTSDTTGDLGRVDQIYRHALFQASGDHALALFAAAIATMEHRHIPLAIGIDLPLTFEAPADFRQRVAKLPRRLFADLPNGDDRDKLQHFFASAWLTLALGSRQAADAIGRGIELGEQLLLTGEAEDPRDIRANRLGQLFAELLSNRPTALPSMMFDAWNRRVKPNRGEQ